MKTLIWLSQYFEVVILILLFVFGCVIFYDYLKLRKRVREYEAEQKDSEESESEEFIITRETQIIERLSGVVCDMYDISSAIKALNNPNLDYSLEELNSAAEDVLKAIQYVYDLNYPIDEEELNK